ncbi:MAG: hypothetical protein MJ200_01605 [Mycoplasmoidaceae bacterium]|nr:hypothetical protein [Mycoplasmoidaceae bacterium]
MKKLKLLLPFMTAGAIATASPIMTSCAKQESAVVVDKKNIGTTLPNESLFHLK